MNDLFLKALKCEPTERPPIWLMRQAGRYMPQYRALRSKYSFRELVGTPELTAEVTMLPIDLLSVDAAILFSDILVLAEVFGFSLEFTEGKGIQLLEPPKEVQHDVEETLAFVPAAIRLLKKQLKVPLIGFSGGPYTVAKYMKRLTPEWLEKITIATIAYLQLQIDAGADVIQIFDSWAGLLEPDEFQQVVLPYLRKIVESIKDQVPVIVFCRGSCKYVSDLVSLQPTAVSFDWQKELSQLRKEVPSHIAIQGNLNPDLLKGPLDILQKRAQQIVHSMKGERGFIFNLGHGIEPETPLDNVQWLVKYILSL